MNQPQHISNDNRLDHLSRSELDWQEKVVLAYLDEPPFASPGPDGHPSGCDVEVALTILKSIGVQQVETRLVTFADLLPGLVNGRWTMNTAMFITSERSKWVEFSHPVWALADGFIIKVGNPKGLTKYETLAVNHTAKLGVVKDTVQRQTALNAGVPVERTVELATQNESIKALLSEQIDAFASTAIGNRVFARRANEARVAYCLLRLGTAAKSKSASSLMMGKRAARMRWLWRLSSRWLTSCSVKANKKRS
jgi:polar amino acid transport system substrate-binding protein